MKLPLSLARKLLLLRQGQTIPATQLNYPFTEKLVDDGVLIRLRTGSNRNSYLLHQNAHLDAYLLNHFGIADLEAFITGYTNEQLTRAGAIGIASNSKLKPIRTFKGFLVNCFSEVPATLHGKPLLLAPNPGTFHFIYDFEDFIPAAETIIVGIENPENFRWVERQQHLFREGNYLFVSRYPQQQHSDMIRWLQNIPNRYLHFGDFDFWGILIYLREYKKYLEDKATLFIPADIGQLLLRFGNRDLYDQQLPDQPDEAIIEEHGIKELLQLLHRHKKVLEQEALIHG